MTIPTKPTAKKAEKSILPLVAPNTASAPADDGGNNSTASSIILLRRGRQLSPATAAILLMVALLGFSIGTIGGLFYFRQYSQTRNHMRFHGFCKIPYDSSNWDPLVYHAVNPGNPVFAAIQKATSEDSSADDQSGAESNNNNSNAVDDAADPFFREEFELGLSDEDNYSKIDVPVFRGQRPARFLHDFKFNQSGIIDMASGRCFIMPLDRETVLPPKSLRDLIQKMQRGYYNIDTSVLKKTMRVVTPELTDYTDVSPRITKECVDMKIYELEKIISGVYKRSTDIVERSKFAEFGGNHISLIDILNMDELD
ncbi:integral membrane protein 2B [Anopheles bellator]|uniref:integral membrane protein 2B n=1 Tax=Anopheles bellator TaxID=139047 RepID=UPI002648EF3B|nr:integral membrane protein 2B [Anopheles bellator]